MNNAAQLVSKMIMDEKVSSEFMISSGVQHAIVQLVMDATAKVHPHSEPEIRLAIGTVMKGLEETGATWNEFLIGESVRGLVHGLTSVGISTEESVKFTIEGVIGYLRNRSDNIAEFAKSIAIGVKSAGEEMGLCEWQLENLFARVTRYIG